MASDPAWPSRRWSAVPAALGAFGLALAFVRSWPGCRLPSTNAELMIVGILLVAVSIGFAYAIASGRRHGSSGSRILAECAGLAALALVLGCIGIPNMVGATNRGCQKRTMGDMRTIATAMLGYRGDAGSFPVMTRGEPIDSLARRLAPTYVKALPRMDGWGHEFVVESDGSAYTVTSYGGCCEPDGPEVHVQPNGGTTTFRADVVFSNGAFVKFPDGTQL